LWCSGTTERVLLITQYHVIVSRCQIGEHIAYLKTGSVIDAIFNFITKPIGNIDGYSTIIGPTTIGIFLGNVENWWWNIGNINRCTSLATVGILYKNILCVWG
jgi:hypothetical protein